MELWNARFTLHKHLKLLKIGQNGEAKENYQNYTYCSKIIGNWIRKFCFKHNPLNANNNDDL